MLSKAEDRISDEITTSRQCRVDEPNDDMGDREAEPSTTHPPKKARQHASVRRTLSFVFGCGPCNRFLFCVGFLAAFLNGLTMPILAYLFSTGMSNISHAQDNGLADVRRLSFRLLALGTYGLFMSWIQYAAFDITAYHASHRFRLQWFQALLRQDQAFFDVYDISGIATQVGGLADKYRRGVGTKFGEGIQYFSTGAGGLLLACIMGRKAAGVIALVVPFISFCCLQVVRLNQNKGTRAAAVYRRAGAIAYAAVSSFKTVLSLNAVPHMIHLYRDATMEAYTQAVRLLPQQGLVNGAMLGSVVAMLCIVNLYGTFLFYRDVRDFGCDPSNAIADNVTCNYSGADVFAAMLGIAFAALGLTQLGNFSEAFSMARGAVFEAIQAIDRVPGAPEEFVFAESLNNSVEMNQSDKSDVEKSMVAVRAILPKYEINATSADGLKPSEVRGQISLKNVHFHYPTRPNDRILKGLTVEILAGQTVAFVGPSGSGKSTLVSLLERFYDPSSGCVELDGLDLKKINVRHLRRLIGYVGQEPTLFATSIKSNIRYGNPLATDDEIIAAAKLANAHDFIMSFTDGYDTHVGDKGSQLSGGQKQRIAIARMLVGNPRLLLLDEATSALDSESELVVQDALDNIVQTKKVTTIIIAHRLSTIRNADQIHVMQSGRVVESGSHAELMEKQDYYYRLVQKQNHSESNPASCTSSETSDSDSESNDAENDHVGNCDNIDSPNSSSFDNIEMTLSKVVFDSDLNPLIEFVDVDFAYPARPTKKIFNAFNLIIQEGRSIALVGPSGEGKSTTVALIERFYDPSAGVVKYCGHDIRDLNVAWYRGQIGYVGQEPTLFKGTIAENIAIGNPSASQEEIEEAARQANAHSFIMSFPDYYQTQVGERGSQLSGGQKQRIAIARALIKKPKVLILDEATSALDNDSEAVVQTAIDDLMASRSCTVILIAHRLSTIRNADRIAYISGGKVLEYGSHDELLENENGLYKRLFHSSQQNASLASIGFGSTACTTSKPIADAEEEVNERLVEKFAREEEAAFDAKRARALARPDLFFLLIGCIGALMQGGGFPIVGVVFAQTLDILFHPVELCPQPDGTVPDGFAKCEEYWGAISNEIRSDSFVIASYWFALVIGALLGNVIAYWGFGTASERLNKRLRDESFTKLLRLDPSFFDQRSVGSITSQLQDDVTRIQSFTGEPLRALLAALASVTVGVTIAFSTMWPFALLFLACLPLMGVAVVVRVKLVMGTDLGNTEAAQDELHTPGGIMVETLLNIRNVSALTLEETRFEDYRKALLQADPNFVQDAIRTGIAGGLSQFVQQWSRSLQLWFGGYLIYNFPEQYLFRDFLVSMFAGIFSVLGLGMALQGISKDRQAVKSAVARIFHLLDSPSTMDPLSSDGKKLE